MTKDRTVQVPSISCGHCVATIKREVLAVEGVLAVEATYETRDVTISWNSEKTSWGQIADVMTQINYPPIL